MILTGVDFETNGLDPSKNFVTEIGFSRWSFEGERREFLDASSFLVKLPPGEKVGAVCEELTGITDQILADFGLDREMAFSILAGVMQGSAFMVAHNRAMEESFLFRELERMPEVQRLFPERAWIDTMTDVAYTRGKKGGTLGHTGADHGMLNWRPHRAGPDSHFMMEFLSLYPAEPILEKLRQPQTDVSAGSKFPFSRKEEAKKLGFQWDPDRKLWHKIIDAQDLTAERAATPFDIFVERNIPARIPEQQRLL